MQQCNTPYTDIYIDLLSINFHLLSALLHCAYHQISDYAIYTVLTTNMVAKNIVLSNIISVASDDILHIYSLSNSRRQVAIADVY